MQSGISALGLPMRLFKRGIDRLAMVVGGKEEETTSPEGKWGGKREKEMKKLILFFV